MNSTQTTLSFFVLNAFIYILFAAGYVDTVDADPSIDLAESIYSHLSFSFIPYRWDDFVHAESPWVAYQFTSKLGLGMALVYMPCVFAAKLISKTTGLLYFETLKTLAAFINPILTAALLTLFFVYFQNSGFTKRRSALIASILGFCTLLLPYSKTCQKDTLQALCLAGAYIFFKKQEFFIVGLFIGFGILVKSVWIIPALPILVWAAYESNKNKRNLEFLLPIFSALILLFWYQWRSFGHPLAIGYNPQMVSVGGMMWNTPLWFGIYEQVFSSDGLFFLNPILILILLWVGKRTFKKKPDLWTVSILTSLFLQIFFYAKWFTPNGGWTLGPRYLLVVIPILFLTIKNSDLDCSVFNRRIAYFCLFIMALFQVIQASIRPSEYYVAKIQLNKKIEISHGAFNIQRFGEKLNLKQDNYPELSRFQTMAGLNFWWTHSAKKLSLIKKTNPQG